MDTGSLGASTGTFTTVEFSVKFRVYFDRYADVGGLSTVFYVYAERYPQHKSVRE